jgi:surface antigen
MLGGCSVSMPMASLLPAHHDDETASIAKPQMAAWLDTKDWHHAKPAFDEALAETTASAVTWSNPDSGARGKFTPVGDAFSGIAGMCRGFRGTIAWGAANKAFEGTACANKAGVWHSTEIKSAKQS